MLESIYQFFVHGFDIIWTIIGGIVGIGVLFVLYPEAAIGVVLFFLAVIGASLLGKGNYSGPMPEVSQTAINNTEDQNKTEGIKISDNPVYEEEKTDPRIQELDAKLKDNNLTPEQKQYLSQLREERLKMIMNERGQTLINRYNASNPVPTVVKSEPQKVNASTIEVQNNSETNNAQPNNQEQPKSNPYDIFK